MPCQVFLLNQKGPQQQRTSGNILLFRGQNSSVDIVATDRMTK